MSPVVHLAYDENNIKPGWIALIIVLLLAIATFLLWRSMNTQLGKIRVPRRAELVDEGSSRPEAEPSAEGADASEDTAGTPDEQPPSKDDAEPGEGPDVRS
jgi:hypothetical protein